MSADLLLPPQRRRDTEHRLTRDKDVWVAGASAAGEAGQIEPGEADGDREGGPV